MINKKADLHSTTKGAFDAIYDGGLKAWINKLRTNFAGPFDVKFPRVFIRGGGPVGMTAALYAKKAKLKTVKIINNYPDYYRQHIVAAKQKADLQIGISTEGGVALPDNEPVFFNGLTTESSASFWQLANTFWVQANDFEPEEGVQQ